MAHEVFAHVGRPRPTRLDLTAVPLKAAHGHFAMLLHSKKGARCPAAPVNPYGNDLPGGLNRNMGTTKHAHAAHAHRHHSHRPTCHFCSPFLSNLIYHSRVPTICQPAAAMEGQKERRRRSPALFRGICGQLPNPSMGLMPLLSRKSSTAAGSALLSSRGRVNRAWGPVMPSAKAMEPSSAMENSSRLGRNP